MSSDKSLLLVIDIVKRLVSLVRQIDPQWEKAYLRYSSHESVRTIQSSYVNGADVKIIES
jgi:hypothetical protein